MNAATIEGSVRLAVPEPEAEPEADSMVAFGPWTPPQAARGCCSTTATVVTLFLEQGFLLLYNNNNDYFST